MQNSFRILHRRLTLRPNSVTHFSNGRAGYVAREYTTCPACEMLLESQHQRKKINKQKFLSAMDDNSTYVCPDRHNLKSADLLNTIEIKGGNSIQNLSALECQQNTYLITWLTFKF